MQCFIININNSLLLTPFIVKHIRRKKNENKWVPIQIRFSDISYPKLLKTSPRQGVRQEVPSLHVKGYKEFYDFSIFSTPDYHVKNSGHVTIKISSSWSNNVLNRLNLSIAKHSERWSWASTCNLLLLYLFLYHSYKPKWTIKRKFRWSSFCWVWLLICIE